MHERNIYKTPPDFTDLAKKFPFFAPYLSLDERGTPKINFHDKNALIALSRALLLKDFGLDVKIPDGVLVPTIPLRLNYILWIEDLITHYLHESDENDNKRQIRGIDIGTGATAIYALLGARKNKWMMTGTEINPDCVTIANENVSNNKMTESVTIVPAIQNSVFGDLLSNSEDGYYYFCMCNPPFFGSDEETDSVAKGRFSSDNMPLRSPPSAAKTGKGAELVTEGGELQFVQNIITESLKFGQKIRIFTTMIGIKRHLKKLLSVLRSHQIWNFATTEFTQGKTTRWGLAWSLHPKVSFISQHPDLVSTFSDVSTLIDFDSLVESYLEELKPETLRCVDKAWVSPTPTPHSHSQSSMEIESEECVKQFEFIATENTWSGQRRKRREMERLRKIQEGQQQQDSLCCPPASKICKIEANKPNPVPSTSTSASEQGTTTMASACDENPVLIHCLIEIQRDDVTLTDVKLTMRFRDGLLGKDGMHQIIQYLKNRFQRDRTDTNSAVYQMSV